MEPWDLLMIICQRCEEKPVAKTEKGQPEEKENLGIPWKPMEEEMINWASQMLQKA